MEEIDGVWRTIRGRRIFIKDGQSLSEAMRESGKFLNNKKASKDLKKFEEQLEYIKEKQDVLCNLDYKKVIEQLGERNGFNEKPQVLSAKEYEKLSNKDYIKVFRGYHDSEKTADEYIKQFKYGKNEYGNGGTQYGVGHYTITEQIDAKSYGKTIEIAIPKNAKIVEYKELMEQHYSNFEKYNNNLEKYSRKYGKKVTDILDDMNNNESATAILSNYDIIKQDNIYIILNRSIIKIKE